jgi:sulfatase maturation enzyme AslB (radical SAM superfamily)
MNDMFLPENGNLRIHSQSGTTIEQGHFVLTMMPSLFCELDCPHCYLSTTERRDPTRLSNEELDILMGKITKYYRSTPIKNKTIHAYQYGGEPTSMGLGAFSEMLDVLDGHFTKEEGYRLRHTILTSLIEVDLDEWEKLIFEKCGGYLQTSYDGRMRGGSYMKKWDQKMRQAKSKGITMATISVVNERLLQEGPEQVLDYLIELGVVEASFLPFMWNTQNDGKKYEKLAPTMNAWSQFMIGITKAWIKRKKEGKKCPEIGQLHFILGQFQNDSPVSNVAGQTLFLLPNGDYALPDYTKGWQEYMSRFGNGLRKEFSEILRSPKRKQYLRRQLTRNYNEDCLACDHSRYCVMEFWKDNRKEDDCFGGKVYVEWVLKNKTEIDRVLGKNRTLSLY